MVKWDHTRASLVFSLSEGADPSEEKEAGDPIVE